jgi:hypothetical protein
MGSIFQIITTTASVSERGTCIKIQDESLNDIFVSVTSDLKHFVPLEEDCPLNRKINPGFE